MPKTALCVRPLRYRPGGVWCLILSVAGMGASFSTWVRVAGALCVDICSWVISRQDGTRASFSRARKVGEQLDPATSYISRTRIGPLSPQFSGISLIHGAQNVTINGGKFSVKQQANDPSNCQYTAYMRPFEAIRLTLST